MAPRTPLLLLALCWSALALWPPQCTAQSRCPYSSVCESAPFPNELIFTVGSLAKFANVSDAPGCIAKCNTTAGAKFFEWTQQEAAGVRAFPASLLKYLRLQGDCYCFRSCLGTLIPFPPIVVPGLQLVVNGYLQACQNNNYP